ncbi:hypothetical protein TcCL_ESM10243 [Trypanosoma cruzi]|nr:hypothetical protein TcCL_ESM10243 [Trypanosoma cruzi]
MAWPTYDAARRCGGFSLLTLALVFSTHCVPERRVLTIPQKCRHTHRKCGRSGPANCRRRSSFALGQPRQLLPCWRQTRPCTDGAVYCFWGGGIVGGWRRAGTGAKRNSPADETPMGSPLVEFRCPTCGF